MTVSASTAPGMACLTLGVVWNEGRVVPRDLTEAGKDFARACDLKMQYACPSLVALVKENGPRYSARRASGGRRELFYPGVAYLCRPGVFRKTPRQRWALFRQSCADRMVARVRRAGGMLSRGAGTAADAALASAYFEKACRGGVAASCFALGNIYRGIKDEAKARQRFQQACDASVRDEIANAAYFRASDNTPAGKPRHSALLWRPNFPA